MDGSIYASKSNAICISAYSIAPKLIRERAWPEIAALLAHELSHLVGLDEDQAVALQIKARNDLRNLDSEQVQQESIRQAVRFLQLKSETQIDITKKKPAEILRQLENANLAFTGIFYWNKALSFFVKRDLDYLFYQRAKFFLAAMYVRILQVDSESEEWKKKYDEYFAKSNKVKFKDLPNLGGGGVHFYGQEFIVKIESLEELQIQLDEIHRYATKALLHFKAMMQSRPLPLLFRPDSDDRSPWISSRASYIVNSVDCNLKGNSPPRPFDKMPDFVAFEIRALSSSYPNYLEIVQTTKTGEIVRTPLYDEAMEAEIFSSTQLVSADGDRKLLLSQRGDSWDSMKRQKIVFETKMDAIYLTKAYGEYENHFSSASDFKGSEIVCVYQLTKK